MTTQELYNQIGGSYDSAKKILQMDRLIGKFILKFLDEKSCAKLLNAYQANDPVGMFEGAHAMKGVCANLGLDKLSGRRQPQTITGFYVSPLCLPTVCG